MKNIDKKRKVQQAIKLIESMKNCYFWNPPGNASSRRYYEGQKSMNFEFNLKRHHYKVDIHTTCSCKNIYFHREIYVDGNRKNIRALRKCLEVLA